MPTPRERRRCGVGEIEPSPAAPALRTADRRPRGDRLGSGSRADSLDAYSAQRAPETRDQRLERVRGARRGRVGPEHVDEAIGGDHLIGMDGQDCQHPSLLPTAELGRAPIRAASSAPRTRSHSGERSDTRPPSQRPGLRACDLRSNGDGAASALHHARSSSSTSAVPLGPDSSRIRIYGRNTPGGQHDANQQDRRPDLRHLSHRRIAGGRRNRTGRQ